MITVIAGGRHRTIRALAALGAVASMVMAGCSIAGQEPDAGSGGRPPVGTSVSPDASGATDPAPTDPAPTDDAPADEAEPGDEAPGVPSPVSSPSDSSGEGEVPDRNAPGDGDGLGDPPPFYANTLPDQGDAVGGDAGVLTDIRLDVHPGYDRVVLEFDGSGVPGWYVRYVDFVIADPSGEALHITGAGVLEVTLVGVDYPEGDLSAYDGPSRMATDDSGAVTEVLLGSTFEGQQQAFIGVDPRELPFRAYRLTGPSRVVVEVQHPR
jgi:hypothetical protein